MQNLGFKASLSSLAISALALSGCVYGEARHVVRTQFAAETDCAEVRVEDRKPFEAGYKEGQLTVRGCGVTRVYTCPADAGFISYDDDELCSFETSVAAQPPAAAMPPAMEDMGGDMSDDTGGDMGGDTMDEPAAEPMDEPAAEPAMDAPSQETGGDAAAEPAAEPEAKPSPFSGKATSKGGKAKASGKLKLGKKK